MGRLVTSGIRTEPTSRRRASETANVLRHDYSSSTEQRRWHASEELDCLDGDASLGFARGTRPNLDADF